MYVGEVPETDVCRTNLDPSPFRHRPVLPTLCGTSLMRPTPYNSLYRVCLLLHHSFAIFSCSTITTRGPIGRKTTSTSVFRLVTEEMRERGQDWRDGGPPPIRQETDRGRTLRPTGPVSRDDQDVPCSLEGMKEAEPFLFVVTTQSRCWTSLSETGRMGRNITTVTPVGTRQTRTHSIKFRK